MLPGDFTRNADFSLPTERIKRAIVGRAGPAHSHFVDATRLATALLGHSIGANMFMLGYAYQLGALPLSAEAIEKAIELNGEAVAMNLAAFQLGPPRRGRSCRGRGAGAAGARQPRTRRAPSRSSFDEMVARRVDFLTAYQNAAYAARYRRRVEEARAAEARQAPGKTGFAEAVARYLFKLMAYKDEYEVARLYTDPAFLEQVASEVDPVSTSATAPHLPSRAAASRPP